MAQPLLVPFICARCGKELVWASVTANVYCKSCRCWVKPSGQAVRSLKLGTVKEPGIEYGQLSLFTVE
jgi:DNA-directed RNA polymerase subunit RPC12/RpoP